MSTLFGFARSSRLLTAADYSSVFSRNIRASDRHFTVLVAKREDHREYDQKEGQGGYARLGMAIAKKRAKRAVDRNRLKRVVRDYFRHHHSELGNIDMVIMNRDAAVKASNTELRKSLDSLWKKIQSQL